jgi:hypothetical protein
VDVPSRCSAILRLSETELDMSSEASKEFGIRGSRLQSPEKAIKCTLAGCDC